MSPALRTGVTQHVLMHDLQDDDSAIATYEAHHQRIWPEVAAHIHHHGVLDMRIHRLGTRLVMVMHTDDAIYDATAMADAQALNPILKEWEALMDTFQAPTPWTPTGQKWVSAPCIFRLGEPI